MKIGTVQKTNSYAVSVQTFDMRIGCSFQWKHSALAKLKDIKEYKKEKDSGSPTAAFLLISTFTNGIQKLSKLQNFKHCCFQTVQWKKNPTFTFLLNDIPLKKKRRQRNSL